MADLNQCRLIDYTSRGPNLLVALSGSLSATMRISEPQQRQPRPGIPECSADQDLRRVRCNALLHRTQNPRFRTC